MGDQRAGAGGRTQGQDTGHRTLDIGPRGKGVVSKVREQVFERKRGVLETGYRKQFSGGRGLKARG